MVTEEETREIEATDNGKKDDLWKDTEERKKI